MTNFTGNVDYIFDTGIVDYSGVTVGPWDTMASSTTYTINPSTTTAGTIFNSTGNFNWSTAVNPVVATSTGTITLTGKDADIVVNGQSLMDAIKKIEERLAILHPAAELEAEWAELKRLGNEYRALEAEIRNKMEVWETLKKQDL